jgi:hypothetical protein
MLNEFDKDLAGIDLTAENASELILAAANKRAKGLADKNTELLSKVTDKENLTAAERSRFTALEAYEADSEIAKAKAANDWAEADRLKDEANNKLFDSLTDENNNYKKSESQRLITDGINSELNEIKLNPLYAKTTKAFFESQSSIVDGKAMIGDKTQSEYITEWAQTDSGKASCLAQANSGGDGKGGGDNQPAVTPETLEACKGDKALEAAYFNKQMAG